MCSRPRLLPSLLTAVGGQLGSQGTVDTHNTCSELSVPGTAVQSNTTHSPFSRDYLKKWSAKGIQVVSWTVNTFDEKNYYESHLGSSYITDSMLEDCAPHF